MLDGAEFGKEIVDVVRGYVEREIGPLKSANESLQARIAELEARPAPERGEQGERGLDGVAPEPDVIAETLTERLKAMVDEAVAALPPPERGEKGEKGDAGEPGTDGQNGADGNDGSNGKDAANIVEALKDSGELVLTLQDGRLIRTGIRDGKDAELAPIDEWDSALTDEQKTGLFASMLRKELGDEELVPLPDPVPAPQTQNMPQLVVHNHLPKRGIEKTVVTKHDERGRIVEYERREA